MTVWLHHGINRILIANINPIDPLLVIHTTDFEETGVGILFDEIIRNYYASKFALFQPQNIAQPAWNTRSVI